MNTIKRTIGAVALAVVTALGYGDDTVGAYGTEREVVDTSPIVQCALDLSDVWDKRNINNEPILWSSLGWEDIAEEEGGKTVTLELVPFKEGDPQTLANGLKGHRQTHVWTPPTAVTKQVYNLKHIVVDGSSLETDLNAYFSFENYDHVAPDEADVRAAIRSDNGTGWAFGIANDAENWWNLAGGPGEGIVAPQGESVFAFTVDGRGTFFFDYELAGGTWTVKVDGVEVRTMEAAADWTGAKFSMDERFVAHVIELVTDLSGSDIAALRNVRWVDGDDRFGRGQGGIGAVDLREGALVARRRSDLMPFAWSSTNFTGNALLKDTGFISIDPQSVASVRVVQVTGEGDDISQWTAEVAGTEKTLVSERQGESTVKWKGAKPGVWKAELVIKTDGSETYRETRILDLRKYIGPGLIISVK